MNEHSQSDLPCLGLRARAKIDPIQLVSEFLKKQERVLFAIADLKRCWRKAGKPPYDARLTDLLEADGIGTPWRREEVEMKKLVEAMVRSPRNNFHQDQAEAHIILWKAADIISLLRREHIFPFLIDSGLTTQALRSSLGKTLCYSSHTVYLVDGKNYVFAYRGSHRARRYYVRPESDSPPDPPAPR